ncbi:hypothetical protein KGP36_01570 [Patescibacteria group bacterium]|nr:hypothetical protein [Patescibacteria group bacterium]
MPDEPIKPFEPEKSATPPEKSVADQLNEEFAQEAEKLAKPKGEDAHIRIEFNSPFG